METSFMLTWMSAHIKTIALKLKRSLALFSRGKIATLYYQDSHFVTRLCRKKWLKEGSRGLFGTITEKNVSFCTHTQYTLRGKKKKRLKVKDKGGEGEKKKRERERRQRAGNLLILK